MHESKYFNKFIYIWQETKNNLDVFTGQSATKESVLHNDQTLYTTPGRLLSAGSEISVQAGY